MSPDLHLLSSAEGQPAGKKGGSGSPWESVPPERPGREPVFSEGGGGVGVGGAVAFADVHRDTLH